MIIFKEEHLLHNAWAYPQYLKSANLRDYVLTNIGVKMRGETELFSAMLYKTQMQWTQECKKTDCLTDII